MAIDKKQKARDRSKEPTKDIPRHAAEVFIKREKQITARDQRKKRIPKAGDRVPAAGRKGASVVSRIDATAESADLKQIGHGLALGTNPLGRINISRRAGRKPERLASRQRSH
jgi:hypothetical protein